MKDLSDAPNDIWALLDDVLDESISASGMQQLDRLLLGNLKAQKLYVRYCQLHLDLQADLCAQRVVDNLRNHFRSTEKATAPAPLVASLGENAHPFSMNSTSVLNSKFARLFIGVVSLLIVAGAWQLLTTHNRENPRRVASAVHDGSVASVPCSIRLASGEVQLALADVGEISVCGPAHLDLINPMRAQLHRGRVNVRVTSEKGRGFVIETPDGDVTDLGTAFNLEVSEGNKSGLIVVEGMVDLRIADLHPNRFATAERLVEGDGVIFNKGGHLERIMSYVRINDSPGNLLGIEPPGSPAIITRVSDNLGIAQTKKYYQIVSRSLREDAKAYVDRPDHEWNGLTEHGMPPYLIGADYVMVFNEDKMHTGLTLDVELNCPARLFVFLDEHVSPPDWLRKDFHDTGDQIGLDVGPYRSASGIWDDKRKRGIGAGNSIDRVFSIWECIVTHKGKVTLGPNSGKDNASNMYGIAAIELSKEKL